MISQVNTGFYNLLKLWPETTARNTAYVVGDVIKPTTYASHSYKCTTAGTSHNTTEPTWTTTNGATTTDGTAVFTCYDTKTYQLKAKQADTVPYVTFGLIISTPQGTFADYEAIENSNYWVNCFSDKSPADVAEIADEVCDCLRTATITVTGYTQMKIVRTFLGAAIWDSETNIYQIPLRFHVQLDKS